MQRQRWWNTIDHLVAVPADFATQAVEFRELMFDACRLRLHCNVPKAISLSGGLDLSSVLSSIAAVDHSGSAQRAFVAAFPGTPQDETAHALLVVERAGAIPVVRPMSGDELSARLDAYLYQFEEIGGLFGAAAWALYREMRSDGIVVSLDGHGGDELLGGYVTHIGQALLRSGGLAAAPRRTLDLIETLRNMHDPAQSGRRPNKALLAALTLPSIRSVARRTSADRRRRHALVDMMLHVRSPIMSAVLTSDEEEAIDALGPLSSVLYRSFHRDSLPQILRNFDVHAMGHGIEVRMPFLDWRLVAMPSRCRTKAKSRKGMLSACCAKQCAACCRSLFACAVTSWGSTCQ